MNKKETDAVVEDLRLDEISFFSSRFTFLNSHKSFRPKCFHTFLGRTGSGKSTLIRTILLDLLKEQRVLVWLSEEDKQSFMKGMYAACGDAELLNNAIVFSELDEKNTSDGILEKVSSIVNYENPAIILLDNLTTSIASTGRFEQQEKNIRDLHAMAKAKDIPIIIVAHTRSEVNTNRLMAEEDIRGSKTVPNLSEYFYIMQMIEDETSKMQTIRVTKSRYHDKAPGKIYRLIYNSDKRNYDKDNELSFAFFKEIFNRRNKL